MKAVRQEIFLPLSGADIILSTSHSAVTLFQHLCSTSEALKDSLLDRQDKNNVLYTAFNASLMELEILFRFIQCCAVLRSRSLNLSFSTKSTKGSFRQVNELPALDKRVDFLSRFFVALKLPEQNLSAQIRLLERVMSEKLLPAGDSAPQLCSIVAALKRLLSIDDVLIRLQESQGQDPSAVWTRSPSEAEMHQLAEQKQRLMFEFITGEHQFLADVRLIIDEYKKPLCDPAFRLIPDWRREEVCAGVFQNIEAIARTSSGLLGKLSEHQTIFHPVLPSIMSILKGTFTSEENGGAFNSYITSYPLAKYLADVEHKSNPKFRALLKVPPPPKRQGSPLLTPSNSFFQRGLALKKSHSFDLFSLLSRPVFRFLRYILLVNQIMNATPRGHADHDECAAVIEALEAIAASSSKRVEAVNGHLDPKGKLVNSSGAADSSLRVLWGSKTPIAVSGLRKVVCVASSMFRSAGASFKTLDAAGKLETVTLSFSEDGVRDLFLIDLALAQSRAGSPRHTTATLATLSEPSSSPIVTLPLADFLMPEVYRGHSILAIGSTEGLTLGLCRRMEGLRLSFDFYSVKKSLGAVTQVATLGLMSLSLLLLSEDKNLTIFPMSAFTTSGADFTVPTNEPTAPNDPGKPVRLASAVEAFVLGHLSGAEFLVVVRKEKKTSLIELFKVSLLLQGGESTAAAAPASANQPMTQLLLVEGFAVVGNAVAFCDNLLAILTASGPVLELVQIRVKLGGTGMSGVPSHTRLSTSATLHSGTGILVKKSSVPINILFISAQEVLVVFAVYLDPFTGMPNRGPHSWILWEGVAISATGHNDLLLVVGKHSIQVFTITTGYLEHAVHSSDDNPQHYQQVLWASLNNGPLPSDVGGLFGALHVLAGRTGVQSVQSICLTRPTS
ncbi:hypothetical protein DXG01_017040 [Tephrocybe rancida]|nr:hypothetical protein DXG01_017040 [Tephrocybe rancida]